MGGTSDVLVVLVGARGFIGRLHAEIHRSLGVEVVEVDVAVPALTPAQLHAIPWPDVIVDVCTPTAVHTESVRWAYELGARRFLVEKPAGANFVDWRSCVADVPDARIFVGHSYMFSTAYQVMLEACPDIARITTAFDKDRAADDLRLRGAGADGRLPDVFQIEVPHQFSMVLAIRPALELMEAHYTGYDIRAPDVREPVSCAARFEHATVPEVWVTSSLRAPRRRQVDLVDHERNRVTALFPESAASPASRVVLFDPHGTSRVLFDGHDDLLRATIKSGLESLGTGAVPWEASAHFASVVLARVAEARRLAVSGAAAAAGADMQPVPGPEEVPSA